MLCSIIVLLKMSDRNTTIKQNPPIKNSGETKMAWPGELYSSVPDKLNWGVYNYGKLNPYWTSVSIASDALSLIVKNKLQTLKIIIL